MMDLQPPGAVQAAAPVVDENSIRAQVLAEQKARVNGINDLFAMFGGRISRCRLSVLPILNVRWSRPAKSC